MKGIILAGGKATRLYPVTKGVCKQMLAVYDKPMIYYPLSMLLLAGIREILIISTPKDLPRFQDLLGDGQQIGVSFSYLAQPKPKGIAESFLLGEQFINKQPVALVLGDNIFYGHDLRLYLRQAALLKRGAVVFAYYVRDPERYGVVSFDAKCNALSIEEKPKSPQSNWAITGIYFYDSEVVGYAKDLKPSHRGELEITDINNRYLAAKKLKVTLLGRGYAWLDTGTHDSLIDASLFIRTIEERQGLKVGCIEEIAYRQKYITNAQLRALASSTHTAYGEYLKRICDER